MKKSDRVLIMEALRLLLVNTAADQYEPDRRTVEDKIATRESMTATVSELSDRLDELKEDQQA